MIKKIMLLGLIVAIMLILTGCVQKASYSEDTTVHKDASEWIDSEEGQANFSLKCSEDIVFCKEPAEWTCPEEDHFVVCRGAASADLCAKEDAYIKWFSDNCPPVNILE